MKPSTFIYLCTTLLFVSCSSTPTGHSAQGSKHATNEVVLNPASPAEMHCPLTDIEVNEFQAVLARAKPKPSAHMGSPVYRLSLNGQTYSFLPPGKLTDYTLAPRDQEEFERLLREVTFYN